jgi:hypothetical protein
VCAVPDDPLEIAFQSTQRLGWRNRCLPLSKNHNSSRERIRGTTLPHLCLVRPDGALRQAGAGLTAFRLPFDFRLVWSGAKLTFSFFRRGITPECTYPYPALDPTSWNDKTVHCRPSTFLLPRLIGHAAVASLFLTGTPSCPLTEAPPAALSFAHELAARTVPVSVTRTRRCSNIQGRVLRRTIYWIRGRFGSCPGDAMLRRGLRRLGRGGRRGGWIR